MKILFLGGHRANSGPQNVNKQLIKYLNNDVSYLNSENKLCKKIELLFKFCFSNIIIISGFSIHAPFICKVAKIFHKKTIYILHGYAKYEIKMNNLGDFEKDSKIEEDLLNNVTLILCVSQKYMEWLKNEKPELSNKLYYLNNGIELKNDLHKIINNDDVIRIAVAGSNRNMKNNIEVCRAVEKMLSENIKVELNIFGKIYDECVDLSQFKFAKIHGNMAQEDFYKELCKNDIFILNSDIESFGLAAVDALSCGCSILVSKNCGVLSVMKLNYMDIIDDPHNIDELVKKIKFVYKKPNNKRIIKSIDLINCSWESTANRLLKICNILYKNEDLLKDMGENRC